MLNVTFIKTTEGKNTKQRKEQRGGIKGNKKKVKKGTLVMKLQYFILPSAAGSRREEQKKDIFCCFVGYRLKNTHLLTK